MISLPGLVTALALNVGLTAGQPVPEQQTETAVQPEAQVTFDGTWQGDIRFDKEGLLSQWGTSAIGETIKIDIHDAAVRVYLKSPNDETGVFEEFMPGAFHIAPVMSNAVIFGTHYSRPKEAGGIYWIETWTLIVAFKDNDTLLVNYARVVNNVGMPLDQEGSKFAIRGVGEFKRIAP